jgi:hypothetical protein
MPYQLGDRTLQLDVAWEHNDVQYPANWLRLSTEQDRAELGITWVNSDPTWNQKWYWGYDSDGNLIPKTYTDLDDKPLAVEQVTYESNMDYMERQVINALRCNVEVSILTSTPIHEFKRLHHIFNCDK